jgi:dolichol-phosphate mannosyltransferase
LVSIILPTYNEAENIQIIIPLIFSVLARHGMGGEVVVVDDNSPDGTGEAAKRMAEIYPVKLLVRKDERGISSAVIRGMELATNEIIVVMDADLSHPVEKIPDLVRPIAEEKVDMVVGSRYVGGGHTQDWGWARRVISRSAGFLASGLTNMTDPTTGFMAIRKTALDGIQLDPIGWKIVLEVAVKSELAFSEVPIAFEGRQTGESKLTFRVQLDYFRHLWRLYCHRFSTLKQLFKFCVVGASGLFIDTAVLVFLVELLSFDPRMAAPFAFLGAATWNYHWDRIYAFNIRAGITTSRNYLYFLLISSLGLCVRIGVMHALITAITFRPRFFYILASILGIAIATLCNFTLAKYFVFRFKDDPKNHRQ